VLYFRASTEVSLTAVRIIRDGSPLLGSQLLQISHMNNKALRGRTSITSINLRSPKKIQYIFRIAQGHSSARPDYTYMPAALGANATSSFLPLTIQRQCPRWYPTLSNPHTHFTTDCNAIPPFLSDCARRILGTCIDAHHHYCRLLPEPSSVTTEHSLELSPDSSARCSRSYKCEETGGWSVFVASAQASPFRQIYFVRQTWEVA
jgi:hypothetical protein